MGGRSEFIWLVTTVLWLWKAVGCSGSGVSIFDLAFFFHVQLKHWKESMAHLKKHMLLCMVMRPWVGKGLGLGSERLWRW